MTSKEIGMELNQLRNFLGISFGVVAILLITSMTIKALVFLYTLTDNSTPEFKMILVIFSLWITCTVISIVTNIIFKVYDLINNKRNEKL